MAITYRLVKGSALTYAELDGNFTHLVEQDALIRDEFASADSVLLNAHIVDTSSAHVSTGITYTPAGSNVVASTVEAKIREMPVSLSDYSVMPTPTTANFWYWDYTNPDSAGQLQLKQSIPATVDMTGGGNVEGCGLIFVGDTSAQTPNAGLAESDMIRMYYTINDNAGGKMQVCLINGLLVSENDAGGSGNEHAGILMTARATGPTTGTEAVGVWGGDFHTEKAASVLDGSMVGIEVGVHKAPALSTAKCYGVHIWSGDRSGITASKAGTAIRVDGSAGWTNLIDFRNTVDSASIFKIDENGNISRTTVTGSATNISEVNTDSTDNTITITGRTAGSANVAAYLQADHGGQINFGSTTAHDVVMVSGTVEVFRLKTLGSVRISPISSAPATAQEGDIYFNSVTKKHYGYDGTNWNAMY